MFILAEFSTNQAFNLLATFNVFADFSFSASSSGRAPAKICRARSQRAPTCCALAAPAVRSAQSSAWVASTCLERASSCAVRRCNSASTCCAEIGWPGGSIPGPRPQGCVCEAEPCGHGACTPPGHCWTIWGCPGLWAPQADKLLWSPRASPASSDRAASRAGKAPGVPSAGSCCCCRRARGEDPCNALLAPLPGAPPAGAPAASGDSVAAPTGRGARRGDAAPPVCGPARSAAAFAELPLGLVASASSAEGSGFWVAPAAELPILGCRGGAGTADRPQARPVRGGWE
mmetsp:Transcript_50694/g.151690  ORF Transcript_50694/g.151690 Transcript_50694/m.151690 type:complete len:288 (+) Transcript_50694:245-1108(+)